MIRRLPLLLFVLVPLGYGLFALTRGMDANWDFRNYHYYNPWAYLTGRIGWDFLAAQRPSFHSPYLDIPYFLLAENLSARAAGFLLACVQGLNYLLLYPIARSLIRGENPDRDRLLAALAALAAMLGGGTLGQVGTSFYDNVTSLGILGAMAIVLVRWDRLSFRDLFAAGFLLGAAAGLKQTMAVYAVGFCAAFLLAGGNFRARFTEAFLLGLGVLAGFALSAGPWMLHLWETYGNPFFPFFNHIFKSPLALPQPYSEASFLPKSPSLWLFFPFHVALDPLLAGESHFRDWGLAASFVALPLAGLTALLKLRPAQAPVDPGRLRYLLWAFALSYLVWLKLFAIYRYALVLEMLARPALLAIVLSLPLVARARLRLGVLALAILILSAKPAEWLHVPWEERHVEVRGPSLDDLAQGLVILGGHEPMSFLLVRFPPTMRFVRIDSSFTNPQETDVGLNRLMQKAIAEHKGPLLALSADFQQADLREKLAQIGLVLETNACRVMTSALIVSRTFPLCHVGRE